MSTVKGKILWVDDEIELLRPHIMFLENRGYDITPVTNAEDALSLIQEHAFDLVLLDEMLNGMDGITALSEIKELHPSLPVIMITKSEEESLMEEAIGGKIDDYLTKPVNPSQILLSCKKILESKKIESERISRDYATEFNQISLALMNPLTWEEWINIYIKLSEWDVELDQHPDLGLRQTLFDQKRACNGEFARFVENNYVRWLEHQDSPYLSVDVISEYLKPLLVSGKKVIFLVIDNLRLDQWLVLESLLYPYFKISRNYYYSILPTATPYSRNALFSGQFPSEIEKMFPKIWKEGTTDDHSRNRFERQLLDQHLAKLGLTLRPEPKYIKILDVKEARSVYKNITSLAKCPLVSIVLNFVDFLAHSRSDSEVLKEITPDEAAYRSLTRSWFEHSYIFRALRKLSRFQNTIVITTDHGSIRSMRGAKVIGDRKTSTNLRYKFGKNLKCDQKHAILIKDPQQFKLPTRGINTNYLIAKEDYYFVYPTDYHHYLSYYKDSFQHGGVSMEEMILPVVILEPK